jgi:hypothetical protein
VRYSERERHLAAIAGLMTVAVAVLLTLYLMPGSDGPPQLTHEQPRKIPPASTTQAKAKASPSASAQAVKTVKAEYAVSGKWKEGFNAELTVTNLSSQPIEGWTVQLQMPPDVSILDAWSARATQQSTSVTLQSQPWNTYLAPGAAVRMGFQAKGAAAAPRSCTINGSPC